MRRTTLVILMVVVLMVGFGVSAYAMGGHLAMDYDTMESRWIGEIYLYQNLGRLKVGGRMRTYMGDWGIKSGAVPAGIPDSQRYDLELDLALSESISIYMIEGCNHYFAMSNNKTERDDYSYLRFGVKYSF